MILAGKYEILEQGGGTAFNVDRARHVGSGRSVYLHRIPGGSSAAADTLKLALQYAVRNREKSILQDAFEENNCTYVVTDDKSEYTSLVDFLRRAVSGGNGRPPQAQPGQVQPRETRIADQNQFQSLLDKSREFPRSSDDLSRQRSVPPPSQKPFPSSEEGEFTRLFNPKTAASPTLSEGDFTPSPPGGEFTQMFSAPARSTDPIQEIGPSPFPPSEPERSGGEFTRFFGPDSRPVLASPKARAGLLGENPLPPAPLSPGSDEPGEFTRIIRSAPLSSVSRETPQLQAERPNSALPSPIALPKLQAPTLPPSIISTAPQQRLQAKGVSPVLILIVALIIAAMAVVVFFLARR